MTANPWAGRYSVYRCFDDAGRCLYVGCSGDLQVRMDYHRRTTSWAPAVVRIKITVHAHKIDALRVERGEITRLRPAWNILGSPLETAADYRNLIAALTERQITHPTRYSRDRLVRLRRQLDRIEQASA